MSLHADALARLASWQPPHAEQARLRERYLAHLRARPDALERSCRPDHLTASTLVLDAAAERVLLTLHAKAGRWFQFGGHCEPGDRTLAAAALREAVEESGLEALELDPVPVQLSEHAVPFCGAATAPGEREVHHLDVRFVALAPAGAAHAVSEESLDVRWWPTHALPDPDPDLVELVALARARVAARGPRPEAQSTGSAGPGTIAESPAAADQPIR